MKTILMSIQPQHCMNIICGKKTIELRTTAPKVWLDWFKNIGNLPEEIKVLIYCTHGSKLTREMNPETYKKLQIENPNAYIINRPQILNGKIVGEFTLRHMDKFNWQNGCLDNQSEYLQNRACISEEMLDKYSDYYHKTLYGYYIEDLKNYHKPKELSEFGLTKAPQSWRYIKE
jgi:predicted transcriptional regulator